MLQIESFDMEKSITNLQNLGLYLKVAIAQLPSSDIKQYLLFETSRDIELETTDDFYFLQNKIVRMLDMITKLDPNLQYQLDEKIPKLLKELNDSINEIVMCIEEKKEALGVVIGTKLRT